jgi:WD repeat-containing protein 42A
VLEGGKKIPLYSISSNPIVSHEFCVAGRDEFIRVYDARKLSRSTVRNLAGDDATSSPEQSEDYKKPLKRFCPHQLQGHSSKLHMTAAVYNYNGREILGSYNDENIYLFDSTHSDMADYIKMYEGHLNSATGKVILVCFYKLYKEIKFILLLFSQRSQLFWRKKPIRCVRV